MFKRVLIANRGEIAVRILRACRELGIKTVTLFQSSDRESLHVRLADECVQLETPGGFMDQAAVLRIASEKKVDAIHPGIGFLAEREEFIRACKQAGIVFIGPPAETVETLRHKIAVLERARGIGIPTPDFSSRSFEAHEITTIRTEAEQLGYPVVVKSYRGGRGRGERLIWSADQLERTVRWTQAEAQAVYGDRRVYLEKAIHPVHQVGVQVLGDAFGNLIHLGEREGSLLYGNQKMIDEAPAICLDQEQRQNLWVAALQIGGLFDYQSVGTVEFLVDGEGRFYFTEIKPRIQMDQPLAEMLARVDLVSEQIRLANGEPLSLKQEHVHLEGWVIQCRIRAEDPWRQFLPSPGRLLNVRLPSGPEVRVDTYLYNGCEVPSDYDPLIVKLAVWGRDRKTCIERMRGALQECQLTGTSTNLPLLQRIFEQPDFLIGNYDTESFLIFSGFGAQEETRLRDLAAITAIAYLKRNQIFHPMIPERINSGWHRESRRLPG